jgi:hypothetical protein
MEAFGGGWPPLVTLFKVLEEADSMDSNLSGSYPPTYEHEHTYSGMRTHINKHDDTYIVVSVCIGACGSVCLMTTHI